MTSPVEHFKKFVSGRTFLKHLTVLAGGTAISQALTIISLPFVTRLYEPDDLGRYGLFISFISISTVGASLMYETAIVAGRDEEEAAVLTFIAVVLAIFNTPLATLVLYILIKYNLIGFGSLPVSTIVWTAAGFSLTSVFQVLRYWLLRKKLFTLISKVTIIQGGIRSLSQLGLGLLPFSWVGLLLGDILGRGCGLGQMLRRTLIDVTQLTFPLNLQRLSQVAYKYLDFPLYSLPSSVINVLAFSLSIPVITDLYGTTAGGSFLLAQRTLAIPMTLISSSVADAFHSQIASYANNQPEKIKSFFWQTAKNLTLLGLFPTLAIAILSPHLFTFIFGKAWTEAGILVAIIAPWTLSKLIVSPLSRIVLVLGGQKSKLIFDATALSTLFVVYFAKQNMKFSLTNTVALMSIMNVFAYSIYFVILIQIAHKSSQTSQV